MIGKNKFDTATYNMVGGFVDHAKPVPAGHPNTYAIKKFQN